MAEQEGLVVPALKTFGEAVASVASHAMFHPVRDYLNGLVWDSMPRLDHWLVDWLGAEDTEYHRQVGRYFLINMVRRIEQPGCVMRQVPVFEGRQNRGKSTAFHLLAQPWFSDTVLRIGDKDAYQALAGIWIYEISEMESFSRAEASTMKAFISSPEDKFRAPYERSPQRQPRQSLFAGSTNATEYLKDWTGNTRFHPVLCGEIDLDAIARGRDQLLAEAVVCCHAGERAYPTRDDENRLYEPEQERRLVGHPWLDVVQDWLRSHTRPQVTVREVLEDAIGMKAIDMGRDQQAATRVGMMLARLDWTKRRISRNGGRDWCWYRPEPEEIEEKKHGEPF